MTTFTHKFFGWTEAEARRHINPDGSEGAIVAVSASLAEGLTLPASAEVGPRASIGDDASIEKNDWWITLGPQGSRDASLTAVQTKDGLRWWVGCKRGITSDEFRALIDSTHKNNNHANTYRHIIQFVETHLERIANEIGRRAGQ